MDEFHNIWVKPQNQPFLYFPVIGCVGCLIIVISELISLTRLRATVLGSERTLWYNQAAAAAPSAITAA